MADALEFAMHKSDILSANESGRRQGSCFQIQSGAGKTLLGNTHGWIDRVIGGWQTSGLIQASSGSVLRLVR